MPTRRGFLALAAATVLASATVATAQDKSIVVSSTTSTEQSGLFGHLLPEFEKAGIEVKVVAQGTGQALDTGRRGEGLRSREIGRREVFGRGTRREALSRDVQRFHSYRSKE